MRFVYTTRPTHARGFTVVELLTAIFITMIMLVLIGQIFEETTKAVSAGINLNAALSNSRTINDQLSRDLGRMLGPGDNGGVGYGVLVIFNKRYTGVPMRGADARSELSSDVRSDQLMFFIESNDGDPLVPMTSTSRTAVTPSYGRGGVSAQTARVWYGHTLRTKPNGTDYSTVLGSPVDQNDPNRFADDWVLGRQGMLLVGPRSSGNDNPYGSLDVESIPDGFGTTIYPGSGTLDAALDTLYRGFNDRCLGQLSGFGDTGPPPFTGLATPNPADDEAVLVDTTIASDYASNNNAGSPTDDATNGIYPYTFLGHRLRVNPTPGRSATHPLSPYDYEFSATQLGQMHPYFMNNCSEFIVEFAGDFDGNGAIDKHTSGQFNGQIKWYSHFANANIGVAQPPTGGSNVLVGASSNGTSNPIYDSSPPGANADGAFIFRHKIDRSKWPWLIRIRYRLHDDNGRMLDLDPSDGKNKPGKWFEHIFNINPKA